MARPGSNRHHGTKGQNPGVDAGSVGLAVSMVPNFLEHFKVLFHCELTPDLNLKSVERPHYGYHLLAAAEFIGLSLGSLAGGMVADAYDVPGPAFGIRSW
jgi:hypothetical protein